MPEPRPFQYTILRLVPRLDRGECVNVGVVVFCRQHRFLAARMALDADRLAVLCPGLAPADVAPALEAIDAVLRGDPAAGPLAGLDQSDRFGWVAARSSTMIQASEVHTGITEDPGATLAHLFERLVASP
jgi:hypothetical protein